MNPERRTALWGVLLSLTVVGAPLVAVAATSATAAAPVVAASTRDTIPPLPAPAPGASGLASVPEALPLTPSDPSGQPVRPARARYLELSLTQPDDAVAMVEAAREELVVPASAVDDVTAFEQALMFRGSDEEPIDPDTGEPIDPVTGEPVDPSASVAMGDAAFERLAERAMIALGGTPQNAVGVNDLAVAMFALGLATQGDQVATGPDGTDFADFDHLKKASITLLELAARTFAGERSVEMNLAYLHSLEPRSDTPPTGSTEPLQDLLDRSPKDATARFLLASIQARRLDIDGLDLALTVVDPFLADPSTAALGHLARGDAYLAGADIRRGESPFVARSMALSGLAEYDEAIRQSGDAGAYAGRAVALDLLGEPAAAAEAQAAAVAADPGSATAELRLAELQGCAGDDSGRRSSADAALAVAGADRVDFATARFIWTGDEDHEEPIVDRGYLGYSIGSARTSWPVEWLPPAFTGGFIISTAAFDEPDTCLTLDETGPLERAATEGLAASLDLRDLASAERTYSTWLEHAPPLPAPDPDPEAEPGPRPIPEGLVAATRLLTGGTPGAQTDPVSAVLAVRPRLAPDAAADVCGLLAAAEPDPAAQSDPAAEPEPSFKDDLLACVAEAADRRGDLATAATTMQRVIRVEEIVGETMANRFLQAGTLIEATGDPDEALRLYRLAASVQATNIAGLAKVGDLELTRGDPDAALSAYQLALSGLDVAASQETAFGQRNERGERRLEQYLHNNVGVARLMLARSEPGGPPDCVSNADACREAAAAFAKAIDSDPDNWVYLMNAGWVARLSGQPAVAASFLQRALAQGPAIPWAIENDLGVIAARAGDLVAARAAFERAIASNPAYDLARWNLGVLESAEGGIGIVTGQRLLSDAIRSNAELKADPLVYLPDDRVYRIEVRSPDRLVLATAPGNGSAVAAVAFGTIAAAGALARLASSFSGPLEEAIGVVAAAIGGRRLRLRGMGRIRVAARRLGVRWRPWFVWIPTFIVLIVTTMVSVGRSAPDAFAAALLATVAATVLALVAHTAGHLVVARRTSADLRPARWNPGIAMALIGIPLQLASGPFLAERVAVASPVRSWWVSAAGVLANVAAAGVAYAAYLIEPLPFLRVLVAVQLAVAAYALIPSDPLDGDRLARYPLVLAIMALAVATASLALAVGVA